MIRMMLAAALLLCACAEKKSDVAITTAVPPPAASRSEPVFYNGRDYKMAYTVSDGVFRVKVTGVTRPMKSGEKQDAINITTSSVRYFGCRDRQSAKIIGAPRFAGEAWTVDARCV